MPHDIYAISARVKNLIAREDIALAQNGLYLVNLFSLFLNELYNFSDTLSEPQQSLLQGILSSHEALPMNIMKLSKKDPGKSLYDQVMDIIPEFSSNEEAYEHFKDEYEAIGQKYGMSGDDFWIEAEESDGLNSYKTEDYNAIRSAHRAISMCLYLIGKDKNE